MTTPIFTLCPDAAAMRAAIAPWLAVDPVPFALVCGIAEKAERTGWSGLITIDGKPVLAVAQTPPRPAIIATPYPVEPRVVAVIADVFRSDQRAVRGVNGPEPWAMAIAQLCSSTPQINDRLRLHRLVGAPRLPHATAGMARPFRADETSLIRQWMLEFNVAVMSPADRGPEPTLADAEAKRPSLLAWTVNDIPVSMAGTARRLLGGWTIAPVYTPPTLRGHGYAGTITHALSAQLVAQGSTYVALYTDLANPISNRLYARIGYVPVMDQVAISWSEQ